MPSVRFKRNGDDHTRQLNLCGEYFPALPPERLEIVKRSIPNTGLCGRPVDLFDNPRPQIWQLTDVRNSSRRDVVGLFKPSSCKFIAIRPDGRHYRILLESPENRNVAWKLRFSREK